jgi:hypothetical protein
MKKTQPDSCDSVARVDGGQATPQPGRPAEGSFNEIVSLIEAARSMQAVISREALWSARGEATALGGRIAHGSRPTLEKRWLAPPHSKALRAKRRRDFFTTS